MKRGKRVLWLTLSLLSVSIALVAVPAQSQFVCMPYYPQMGTLEIYHHYTFEEGVYTPHFYRYDPYPNYSAYSYNVPPHYTAWGLSSYRGLDEGRGQPYRRSSLSFRY